MNLERAERYSTSEYADIEIYGNITRLRAMMKNLSSTGAGLELLGDDSPLKKGDLINITIDLQSLSKSHNVDAEVVWIKGPVVGVCFVKKEDVVERIFMRGND